MYSGALIQLMPVRSVLYGVSVSQSDWLSWLARAWIDLAGLV